MLTAQNFNMILIACASLMTLCSIACFILLRKARTETQNCVAVVTQLEKELAETSRDMDTISCRATRQDRRVAWIESRVRNNQVAAPALLDESQTAVSGKPTITERRHRVIQLTKRGVDCNTIATMLNMPHGEVELMISLSHLN